MIKLLCNIVSNYDKKVKLMSKLIKKKKTSNVQTHIDQAYKLIDEFLPGDYVDLVIEKLPNDKQITKRMIRLVRNQVNTKTNPKLEILNAIVEVALENKNQVEKLKKQLMI